MSRLHDLQGSFVRTDTGSYKLTPDHDVWMMNMAMDCHDGEWPNDWRWTLIYDMAQECREGDEDWMYEFSDSHTDTYNADLLRWLNDSMSRAGYTERDVYDDMWDALRNAQYNAILRMCDIFYNYINERG